MGIAYQRAHVLYQQERYAQAQQEFERDLAEEPRKSSTIAMIAMCMTNLHQIKKARTKAEEAIALDPGNAFAHYCLAWALYKDDKYVTRRGFSLAHNDHTLVAQRYKLVEGALLEALRLQPRNPNYHSLLAFTRLSRGNARGALDSANACLAIDPHHSDGHRAAALALSRLGQFGLAKDASANAVSAQPMGSETHLTRAVMLLRHGKPEQALPHFREAVRLEPGSLPARRGLLECLRMHWAFYRWVARLHYVSWITAVLYVTSFVIVDFTFSAHNTDNRNPTPWTAGPVCALLGGTALFCWLCFSRHFADLMLLRDPLARRMLPVTRKVIAWLVAGCTVGILGSAGALVALTARDQIADAPIAVAGAFIGIVLLAKLILVRIERSANLKR
jgi:tetratricopeptide (TPR) repeat protein